MPRPTLSWAGVDVLMGKASHSDQKMLDQLGLITTYFNFPRQALKDRTENGCGDFNQGNG